MTDVANQDRRGLENLISSLLSYLRELANDATIQGNSSLIKEKAENEGILGCLSIIENPPLIGLRTLPQ